MQGPVPRLVLASQSAARSALMRDAGLVFETKPAHVDEEMIKEAARKQGVEAAEAALLLAEAKALRVSNNDTDALVIGADQILVCDGIWYSKPANLTEAATQLRSLRGREHELVSALVCHRQGRRMWQHVARSRLTMRNFSDSFLEAYLATEADLVLASVGAYQIEGRGLHLFAQVEGEFSAILGLPMLALLGFLREHGLLQN